MRAGSFPIAARVRDEIGKGDTRILNTPVYPLIQTATRKATVDVPAAGQVRVAATPWLWRGVVPLEVPETTFATTANKTYHLRAAVDPATLAVTVALRDLADAAYNPAPAKAEDDTFFDAGHDELLLAKVVTNGAGAAMITTIANAPDLRASVLAAGTNIQNANLNATTFDFAWPLAWPRAPEVQTYEVMLMGHNGGTESDDDREVRVFGTNTATSLPALTRYGAKARILRDFLNALTILGTFHA